MNTATYLVLAVANVFAFLRFVPLRWFPLLNLALAVSLPLIAAWVAGRRPNSPTIVFTLTLAAYLSLGFAALALRR